MEAIHRDGAIIVHHPSDKVSGLTVYDRYVSGGPLCNADEVAVLQDIKTVDAPMCAFFICKYRPWAITRAPTDLFEHFKGLSKGATAMTSANGLALFTGASSGTGAIYANSPARCGYDLILVARDKLQLLQQRPDRRAGVTATKSKRDIYRIEFRFVHIGRFRTH
jgi:hypothetical protein